jgi:hypothetical protein
MSEQQRIDHFQRDGLRLEATGLSESKRQLSICGGYLIVVEERMVNGQPRKRKRRVRLTVGEREYLAGRRQLG